MKKELIQQVWLPSHFISGGHCDHYWPLANSWEHGPHNVLYVTDRLMVLWYTPGAMDHAVPVCQGCFVQIARLTIMCLLSLPGSWVSAVMAGYQQDVPVQPASKKASNPKTHLGFPGQRFSIHVTTVCCQRKSTSCVALSETCAWPSWTCQWLESCSSFYANHQTKGGCDNTKMGLCVSDNKEKEIFKSFLN